MRFVVPAILFLRLSMRIDFCVRGGEGVLPMVVFSFRNAGNKLVDVAGGCCRWLMA